MKQKKHYFILAVVGTCLTMGFSNCSKVQVSDINQDGNALKAGGVGGIGGTGGVGGLGPGPAGEQVIPDLSGKQINSTSDLKIDGDLLDIVLVIDDSGSMKDDSQQMASRLSEFVTKLSQSGVNWQTCWIDTDLGTDGTPKPWVFTNSGAAAPANRTLVNSMTANFARIFTDTVDAISFGKGSGDERGVAQLRRFVERKAEHTCLRPGAALTSIIISDEDERSAGGNPSLSQYKPIEDIDKPQLMLLSLANKAMIGRYYHNSIVVKSGDTACLAKQTLSETAKYGTYYETLSNLTKGGVGSICDGNYSTNMNLFFDKVSSGLKSLQLICQPVAGSLKVTVDQPANTYSYQQSGGSLVFSLLSANTYHVTLSYTCK